MVNPLQKIMSTPVMQARLLRLQVTLVGVAMDFWKDTPFPKKEKKLKPVKVKDHTKDKKKEVVTSDPNVSKPWFADFIQVKEQIWGEGNVFPGGEAYLDNLIAPLGLTKEKSVLDLSAGVGGLARKLATETQIYVTALELNKKLAARGMVMSIAAGKSKLAPVDCYDPAEFEAGKKYDCLLARELFFRVIAKEKFFKAVAASLKPNEGQIVFTDFILEEANKEKPAIKAWMASEYNISPMTYIDMVKEWKGLGFDMRVAEDQTKFYQEEIMKALAAFSSFLTSNHPSPDTKPSIVKEIDLWSKRLAAMNEGLRYCRFYGIKR